MELEYQKAVSELLNVYTDIDLLALELCAARIPEAPRLEAELELAEQIREERIHYLIQEKRLAELGFPFQRILPPELLVAIRRRFSRMSWFEFLVGLQIGIEGIGIAIVEKISEKADPETQASLVVPIKDEKRQTGFGVRELKKMIELQSTDERRETAEHILALLKELQELGNHIPVEFEKNWNVLGLTKEEVMCAALARTESLFTELGLPMPASVAF